MKKILYSLLLIVCLITACSCGNEPTGTPIGTEDVAVTTGGSPETNAPETDPPATTAAVTTTVPVTTAPITTAPPATTVPATTQDLSPTKPYNSVLARYDTWDKVKITSVKGIDNKEAIDLISGLITHNYNIYANICYGGALGYDDNQILEINGEKYCAVNEQFAHSSYYNFLSIDDLREYIYLVKGENLSIIEEMYKDINNGATTTFYINLDEIRKGAVCDNWASCSWELEKTYIYNGSLNYVVNIEAVLAETLEKKTYQWDICRKNGIYVCADPLTPNFESVTADKELEGILIDLVSENNKWNDIYSNLNVFGVIDSESWCGETMPGLKNYELKLNSEFKNLDDIINYFTKIYFKKDAEKFVNKWFFEKNGKVYIYSALHGSRLEKLFYELTKVTYLDDTRCEFILSIRQEISPSGSEYYYTASKDNGVWKLTRHYELFSNKASFPVGYYIS